MHKQTSNFLVEGILKRGLRGSTIETATIPRCLPSPSWGSRVELISHNISKKTLLASLTHTQQALIDCQEFWAFNAAKRQAVPWWLWVLGAGGGGILHHIVHIFAEPIPCHELRMQRYWNKQICTQIYIFFKNPRKKVETFTAAWKEEDALVSSLNTKKCKTYTKKNSPQKRQSPLLTCNLYLRGCLHIH